MSRNEPEYDPDCEYLGKLEFARDTHGPGKLKEVHVCRNKKCPWTFCETAFKARSCPEQEVMPV